MNMKQGIGHYMRFGCAVALGVVIGHGPSALAGWTGSMNGSGFGKASVNVTSSTLKSNTVATALMTSPSAAMTNTPGFVAGGPLPSGASTKTLARILGQPGYVWKSTTTASNGDKTDNSELTGYVTATSRVSSTTLEVLSSTIETNGCSDGQALYSFSWHWSGSDAGAAQQIKFYEFDAALPTNFTGDVGSLPGAVQLPTDFPFPVRAYVFIPECPTCCEGPCPTNFDEVINYSFCATNDPNLVYMVTDGIAVSLPCPLSFTGFLPPIGGGDVTGGTCASAVRGFKLGSTIPIKMTLLNCDGSPVLTGSHTIQLSKCDGTVGGESAVDASPTGGATTGNLFQPDGSGTWHFNLATKGLSAGTWKIIATLSDGSQHYVYIDLKP
ncbi:MAG TPA: PxKF domain-containing protein [Verrucomicrobiae bacterium]|nr:PxKF domain-containing protein [Verrucomicrobiae bacterium]